jgi:hypothetical protein
VRTLLELAAARLRNQRLAGNGLDTPVDVVRWLGAMQSQERSIAKWSVAQRTSGSNEASVDAALAGGDIIRTHVLRPTWHYVAAEDLRWIVELTAPRVHRQNGPHYRKFEVDDALSVRARRVFERVLAGSALTRMELARALEQAKIPAGELRLGYILIRAELDLVICSGPPSGKQHTYALVDERAPSTGPRNHDEALAELATRYFRSHGPATLKDFTWWSSLTMADARRAVDAAGLLLSVVREREYWSARARSAAARSRAPSVHLLQGYDEYVVAYRDSRDVYGDTRLPGTPKAAPSPFLHAVILRGQVVGSWRVVPRAKSVMIEMRLRAEPSARDARGLDAAVDRYGRFVGKTAEWRLV